MHPLEECAWKKIPQTLLNTSDDNLLNLVSCYRIRLHDIPKKITRVLEEESPLLMNVYPEVITPIKVFAELTLLPFFSARNWDFNHNALDFKVSCTI